MFRTMQKKTSNFHGVVYFGPPLIAVQKECCDKPTKFKVGLPTFELTTPLENSTEYLIC